jgi:hypothetical protein
MSVCGKLQSMKVCRKAFMANCIYTIQPKVVDFTDQLSVAAVPAYHRHEDLLFQNLITEGHVT